MIIMLKTSNSSRKKVCILAATPMSIKAFMVDQIKALSKFHDITLVSSGSEECLSELLNDNVSFKSINFSRKIDVLNDCVSLIQLIMFFRQNEFDVVHSIMPKTGFISMVAARLTGVNLRFHTFTGQVWATRSGISRQMLKSFDRVIAYTASNLLADSASQRLFILANKVTYPSKIEVLAEGSISGVNLEKFSFDSVARKDIRDEFGISIDEILFLFLGRLSKDKGILDLILAFELISAELSVVHLLLVGPDEDLMEEEIQLLSSKFPTRVHRVGFTDTPERYMSASDVFCLPSYREGFGSVIIESAAIGIPAIASKIYGLTDAIEDNITGILHPPGNVKLIAEAMKEMVINPSLRHSMGKSAHKRALEKFTQDRLTQAFLDFYHCHLS